MNGVGLANPGVDDFAPIAHTDDYMKDGVAVRVIMQMAAHSVQVSPDVVERLEGLNPYFSYWA